MREALVRLAGEGLLEKTAEGVFRVRSVSIREFFECMEVREVLECHAIERAIAVARDADRPVDVVVSCAFGSPFDDVVMTRDLAPFIARVRDTGRVTVTLADTTGVATPLLVRQATELVGNDVGLHFHDTRGTALLNAHTGLDLGVRRFDTSVGGIGGSPFAPNASGNLATESLVALLHAEGWTTGIDLDALIGVGVELQRTLGHALPSPFVQLAG